MKCNALFSSTPHSWMDDITIATRVYLTNSSNSFLEVIDDVNTSCNYTSTSLDSLFDTGKITGIVNFAGLGTILSSMFTSVIMAALMGSIYRVLTLTSISAQHRINQSVLSAEAKFFCNFAASLAPLVVLQVFAHYYSIAIMYDTLLRTLALALASSKDVGNSLNEVGYYLRENDLISSFKNSNLTNLLNQNYIYTIRSLLSIAPILFELPFISTPHVCQSAEFGIGAIKTLNLSIIANYTHVMHLFKFTETFGHLLGKFTADGLIILLKKVNIVPDLRDPLAPVISYVIPPPKGISKIVQQIKKQQLRNHNKLAAQNPNPQPKKCKANAERNDGLVQDWLHQYSDNKSFKVKKLKKQRPQESTTENKIQSNSLVVEDTREAIEIPSTTMILTPLSSEHTNLWGIVSAKDNLGLFTEALQRAELGVSGDGPLKFIARISNGQNHYELKPLGRSDFRAVGKNYLDDQVEDALYSALKKYFSYEEAIPLAAELFSQISLTDETRRPEIIVLDRIGRHQEASRIFRGA